jgi:hypothetical protein
VPRQGVHVVIRLQAARLVAIGCCRLGPDPPHAHPPALGGEELRCGSRCRGAVVRCCRQAGLSAASTIHPASTWPSSCSRAWSSTWPAEQVSLSNSPGPARHCCMCPQESVAPLTPKSPQRPITASHTLCTAAPRAAAGGWAGNLPRAHMLGPLWPRPGSSPQASQRWQSTAGAGQGGGVLCGWLLEWAASAALACRVGSGTAAAGAAVPGDAHAAVQPAARSCTTRQAGAC